MINMDEYYNKIVDAKTENKIKKTIKLNMYVNIIYIIVLFISIPFMIFGVVEIISKNDPTFYFIGFASLTIDVSILLHAQSRDPLKGRDINDKVYVYMRFLRDEIAIEGLIKKNSLRKSLKINILIVRVNRQLHIIENNIKNAFIFQAIDYNEKINLIGRIINILREKTMNLVKEKKTKEVISLIDYIISLYEYTAFNELINDDGCRKMISDRESKIKELENQIDEIQKIEINEADSSILNKIFKFVPKPYFLGGIVLVSGIILYYFKDKYTEIFDFVVFFGVLITIIGFVFQVSPKSNKVD